jgi:hypothetical protein
MKRLYLAAVTGLWAATPVSAQEGALAPTAPVVPTPVLQNGSLLTPSGGSGSWGTSSGPRLFTASKWSPFRNPATASATEPLAPSAVTYGHSSLPPLPAGVGGYDGQCGTAGCAPKRDRSCLDHLKAWLCYQPSKTELPKLRPTPYVTPLIGMFPCVPGPSCGTGCATANCAPNGHPHVTAPGQPMSPAMPPPIPPAAGAGAVMMPPRGVQGAMIAPTWQGRTTPAPSAPGIAGYRFATPESHSGAKPAPGPVVGASLKVPASK